ARSAVDIAAATDALLDHADARLALGASLRAAGRAADADAEERRAVELWEAKGATLLAERARSHTGIATPLLADASVSASPHRRVSPNTATATIASVDAAFARRCLEAVAALASPAYAQAEQRTGP